jgi:hypothetical protein
MAEMPPLPSGFTLDSQPDIPPLPAGFTIDAVPMTNAMVVRIR